MGTSVASAGDVNGDGYADVIVGAPEMDLSAGGIQDGGAAYVFLGSPSGIADDSLGAAVGLEFPAQTDASRGTSVASAGDVNGDGYADVVMGAAGWDAGQIDEGVAFVYQGNSSGRPARARQLRGDGSGTPVQPGGASYDADAVVIELVARSPRGRERAKLEVEICPAGEQFGDAACTTKLSASWIDLGTTGVTFSETLTDLTPGMLYSWRARAHYVPYSSTHAGITPMARIGPWFRLAGRATPGDVRVIPEPDAVLSLAGGITLLAALARLRPARRSDHSLRCEPSNKAQT